MWSSGSNLFCLYWLSFSQSSRLYESIDGHRLRRCPLLMVAVPMAVVFELEGHSLQHLAKS
jgi:hypothetical protein